MRFAINVKIDAPAETQDRLREILATVVEDALARMPFDSHVGTTAPKTVGSHLLCACGCGR